jgi:phosphatidylserine decarboxylase
MVSVVSHAETVQPKKVSSITTPGKTSEAAIVAELRTLIAKIPETRKAIENTLKTQDKTSKWNNFSVDDFLNYFNQWLVFNIGYDDPKKYVLQFDELVNTGGGDYLFNNNVFSSWFIKFLDARGDYLDTPASAVTIKDWIKKLGPKMNDFVIPKNGFQNFNEFFLRELKDNARPLGGKGNQYAVNSVADGTICQIYPNDLDENFIIKRDVINVRQAMNNSPYAERFIGGPIVDTLLWFTDYHHFHAPVSGKLLEVTDYTGSYNYNFANVNWYKHLAKHKRTCYIFDTQKVGLVAMIPVGFWAVGSIVTDKKMVKGCNIQAGQKIGHFKYGGSSILLIFEPNKVDFVIDIPKVKTGDHGVAVKVKQLIAQGKKK